MIFLPNCYTVAYMVLSTHAFVGALAGRLLPGNPVAAFAVGFTSHFLLDAIPHWDYQLSSITGSGMEKNMQVKSRAFLRDSLKMGTDLVLAVLLVWFAMKEMPGAGPSMIAGAIGGFTPDALQFLFWKVRSEPLASIQRFHQWIHTSVRIKNPHVGIPAQMAVVIILTVLFAVNAVHAGVLN